MKDLAGEIIRLQGELDREIEHRRAALGWRLKEKIGEFEQGVVQRHRLLKMSLPKFFFGTTPAIVATTPVIYSLMLPLVLLDLWISAYQAICFPAYKIPKVRRRDYIAFDRRHLNYLNPIESLNCSFCAYANGLAGYFREVSSRTEQYWCPIKHALKITDPHRRYYEFLEYGDAEGYRERLKDFRERLKDEPSPTEDQRRA